MITVKMDSSNTWVEQQMIVWETFKYNCYEVIGIADVLLAKSLFHLWHFLYFTLKVSPISTNYLFTA